jgi:indolepyruvate ferredoxin oxidoreductase beta subunit
MKEFNIVLAGVGGQGTILAAEAIGAAAVKDELNVRVSEIHGMAQRGGAVVSTVRIGETVLASTVLEGRADVILGFEPFETIRNLKYASEKTLVIMNTERMPPAELAAKNMKYPEMEELVNKVHLFTSHVVLVEASRLAKRAGSSLAQNVVLLGALAGTEVLPVKTQSLKKAIGELVPAKHLDVNLRAFELGCESVRRRKHKT